jgi:hypothetical protein
LIWNWKGLQTPSKRFGDYAFKLDAGFRLNPGGNEVEVAEAVGGGFLQRENGGGLAVEDEAAGGVGFGA